MLHNILIWSTHTYIRENVESATIASNPRPTRDQRPNFTDQRPVFANQRPVECQVVFHLSARVNQVLRLPRKLRIHVDTVLCPSRNLHFKVNKVLSMSRGNAPPTHSALQGSHIIAFPATKSALQDRQSHAPAAGQASD